MRLGLELEGKEIHMVSVNKIGAESTQQNMAEKCSFPLLQDVADVDAWALHQGDKDDIFIFDAEGVLVTYLPHGGDISTNLSSDDGFANVKSAIENALGL